MAPPKYDAVIVGAGLAGLYMLHKLRNQMGLTAKVFEKAGDVGGTWNWNRYPGARCDVESVEYSYSFDDKLQQEWNWSSRYATQPELLKYLKHCAERFDLLKDIQFDTSVVSAHFHEDTNEWEIRTSTGEVAFASYCIMATGCLSYPSIPTFKGQDQFKGQLHHTGNWPHKGVDFAGKRVGVIGTGSSGVQSISAVAQQASHLVVFQRTPCYCVPAQDGPLSAEYLAEYKSHYSESRALARNHIFGFALENNQKLATAATDAERQAEYQKRWDRGGLGIFFSFADISYDPAANATLSDFIRGKIKEVVKNDEVARLLTPPYPIGSKRTVVDTSYYETFNRDNVTLVDIKATPIEEFTPTGLKVGDKEYALDVIVVATGFDAVTGALDAIDIRGVGGLELKKKWESGPKEYLGLVSSGFPNLFTITGPGSPSVISAMNVSIEHHVEFIGDLVAYMREHNHKTVDAAPEAEKGWTEHVDLVASMLIFSKVDSWYMGCNIPGKPRVCLAYGGGAAPYAAKCKEVASQGYTGFTFA